MNQFILFLLIMVGVSTVTPLILYSLAPPEAYKKSPFLMFIERVLLAAVVLGLPFWLLLRPSVQDLQTSREAFGYFLPVAMWLSIAVWYFVKLRLTEKKPHHVMTRIFAGSAAFFALFLFMFGPLLLFYWANGIPLDGPAPEKAGWLLAICGGLGAGAAALTFSLVLQASGHFTDQEIDKMWRGGR